MSMSSSMMTQLPSGMKSRPSGFSPIAGAHEPSTPASALSDQRMQSLHIENLHRLAFDAHQSLDLKPRQQPAHRLEPKSEIAADVGAAHPQHEPRCRESQRLIALPEIEKERRDSFLRAHSSQQHQRVALGLDLL